MTPERWQFAKKILEDSLEREASARGVSGGGRRR